MRDCSLLERTESRSGTAAAGGGRVSLGSAVQGGPGELEERKILHLLHTSISSVQSPPTLTAFQVSLLGIFLLICRIDRKLDVERSSLEVGRERTPPCFGGV